MKYRFLKDGEWVQLKTEFRFRCCDCGLVHSGEYRKVIGSKEVEIRVFRNNRSTSAIRRRMKDKILLLAATIMHGKGSQ